MKAGFVALVGRPNVGKSTLLNRLVGQKLSIVSARPQTTRHRILGIKTTDAAQMVFIDTPGVHSAGKKAMNRYLNRTAVNSLSQADLIVWLVDRAAWLPEDDHILRKLTRTSTPVILAINKVDRLRDKTVLMPFLSTAARHYPFREIIPLSALQGTNLAALEASILALLPEGRPIYPEEQVSDRPERFFAAEIIREKLLHRLGQEVPHALTVEIEHFHEATALTTIHAVIWVEREGQKAIVIGQEGRVLKAAGTSARRELERFLECKVHLNLWVKVRKGWSDDERALLSLGYSE